MPVRFDHLPKISSFTLLLVVMSVLLSPLQGQESRIAKQIIQHDATFSTLQPMQPLAAIQARNADLDAAADLVSQTAHFYEMEPNALNAILQQAPEFLLLELTLENGKPIRLKLQQAEIFTPSFRLYASSDPAKPYPYEKGKYYWGIVEGNTSSLAAICISRDEIMGFVQIGDHHFTLGKLQNSSTHILYETNKLKAERSLNCFADELEQVMDEEVTQAGSRAADNCVKMYIQVDYDIFVQKGGVTQAASYVNSAFAQVAIMYANEAINFAINEMVVWNTPDPFTGPSTSDYLNQFRNYLGGVFNGDLAHLVGYAGGGGIAYLDVLCNPNFGVGYSGINSTFNNVPTYSWTIEVLTHEIGHNLGSPHTHACAWNGNGTAIDGCGPAAGYSEGCNAPLPTNGGTVMSYCHLIGGVGINFNNGFGPQPGDRIRTEVYNAPCLDACGPPIQFDAGITAIIDPISFPCAATITPVVTLKNFGAVTLTNVTINYKLDNGAVQTYAWTGSLTQNQTINVNMPNISFGAGNHTYLAYTSNPNGQQDEDQTNNQSSKTFTYIVDWCVCNAASASISPNPLTHVGSGSSSASAALPAGSKKPAFTITNLNAKINGPQNSRFIDIVTVTYLDGNNVNRTYGTFSGANQSSVNVDIQDFVNSISISLSNGYGNNYNGTLSINFSTVNYCGPTGGCADDDNDGVCNVDDVCPGFDDNLIGDPCNDNDPCTENDVYTMNCVCEGTPVSGCGGCTEVSSSFSPNPLTHLGPGQSSSSVTIPANNTDVSFTISNLDAKLNGAPSGRYIDHVTVNYVNGSGNTVQYGIFRGDQVSTVNVSIAGVVQSVTLILKDIYDGNAAPTVLSVSMSTVTSCAPGTLIGAETGTVHSVEVYPNPATNDLFVRWNVAPETAVVKVYNAVGTLLSTYTYNQVPVALISVPSLKLSGDQLIFLSIRADGVDLGMKRVMVKN